MVDKLPALLKLNLKKSTWTISEAITKAVKRVDKDLELGDLDNLNSGSTCCLTLIKHKTIYFSNTGDSRAILISFDPENERNPIASVKGTADHTCEVEAESKRILSKGGRISKISNKFGPLRVWLKFEDKPGLAMTRSIGDHVAREVGVIATPDVNSHEVTQESALVIGSDGLYEFMDNFEIAKIVWENKHLDASFIARTLVDRATEKWKKVQNYLDDIT